MQTIVNRVTHQETSLREVSGEGINSPLARTFVCYRIPGNPSMTKPACQERQAQCYERDNERIRNPLSECRGCPGPSHAEDYIKSLPHEGSGEIGTSGGGGMVLGQCSICNTPAWTTGGYCMSCHGQVKIAESHGVGKEDALAMLHHYYAAGGKRPTRGGKNNSARTLIDWEGELGKMSKSGLHNSQPEPLKESPKSATKKKRSPDLPSIKLPITERERPIIEWIDRKAAAERRNRSGQVWALLEEIMKGEGA